jgi:predicted metal-binding membrane protein
MTVRAERVSAVAAVLLLIGSAWILAVHQMRGMDMGPGSGLGSFPFFTATWTAMMAAMMLPSALPAAIASNEAASGRGGPAALRTLLFSACYVAVWAVAGAAAYTAYRGIRAADLGFLAWSREGAHIAGAAIVGAGLYELTPFKRACLARCRHGNYGVESGLAAGARYGLSCLGCSAGLMLVLFALGAMSVRWMLLVAALVFAEKVPRVGGSLVVPIALLLVGLGLWLALDASTLPGLTQPMD